MNPSVYDLDTPSALVDADRVQRNCERMRERAANLQVVLRPHVKTHKCVPAARLQVGGRSGPITVSTFAEAGRLGPAGFRDVTLAVPLAASRADQAVQLRRDLDRLGVLLDHPDTLAELERVSQKRRVRMEVLLKVDCGYHRAGVDPGSELAVSMVRRLAGSDWLEFGGILTHAGHAYACDSAEAVRDVARQEREVMVGFADRLRSAGLDVPCVSVGSTPTACVADDLTGVDEIRPGNYTFFDAFQAGLGICDLTDVAFSVLTTVVGRYPHRDALVVDAGALALSKDAGSGRGGYGVACSADGQWIWSDLRVDSLSQEHGVLIATDGLGPSDHPVGEKLRILPNHSCLAAALHDRYHVVQDEAVVDRWSPVRGW
jgi:D-serine deaminase-like pyridoxal phosphate-dependent protein